MNSFSNNGSSGRPLVGISVEGKECLACRKLSKYVEDEIQWHNTRCGLKGDKLNRILIVGGPGSGKTTLAHRIGPRLGIEVHELDLIAFTGKDYVERSLSERLEDVTRIAARPAWITEGLFILWTEPLLECADIIVWLDHVGWGKSMRRTVRRFFSLALQEAKNRRGIEKFSRFRDYARRLSQLIQVYFSSRVYYGIHPSPEDNHVESRQNTAMYLKLYKDKVIHCQNDVAVEDFVSYIYYCSDRSTKE